MSKIYNVGVAIYPDSPEAIVFNHPKGFSSLTQALPNLARSLGEFVIWRESQKKLSCTQCHHKHYLETKSCLMCQGYLGPYVGSFSVEEWFDLFQYVDLPQRPKVSACMNLHGKVSKLLWNPWIRGSGEVHWLSDWGLEFLWHLLPAEFKDPNQELLVSAEAVFHHYDWNLE